ncbi:MAG: Ig-like domain-containing protein [Bulleidia sp.]
MKRKIIALLVSFVLAVNIVPVQAKDSSGSLSFGNTLIRVDVNAENGRFTVSTLDGLPSKTTDRNSFLSFLNTVPDTGFTTFRINGEDYIFGNDYGNAGGIVTPTYLSGSTAVTVWQVNGVEVTQTLKLVTDFSDPDVGNVRIRYSVSNGSGAQVSIGSRILIDTMLGANDGSLLLAGRDYITNETSLKGEQVPAVWQSMDRKIASNVNSRGVLYGWVDSVAPDEMIAAHWNTLSETKWECEVNPYLNFTSDQNPYGRADSAVALYYYPASLHAGGTAVYETYYGIGSVSDTIGSDALTVQIEAPQKLVLNTDQTGYVYGSDPFEIMVSITNNSTDTMNDVLVKLGLSSSLSVIDTDEQYLDIRADETVHASFYVHPQTVNTTVVEEAGIQVSYGDELCEGVKYIILPGIKGELPSMSFSQAAPTSMYTGTKTKKITIKGKGFSYLNADNAWEMKLVDQLNGNSASIMHGDVSISDDTSLTVTLPDCESFAYQAHPYSLRLETENYGTMDVEVTMSDDPKLNVVEYGLMLVGKDTVNEIYDVRLLEKETEEMPEGFETLLTIRGTISSYTIADHVYYSIASGALINNAILYRNPFNANAEITVTRYSDNVDSLQDSFRDAFAGYDWYGNMHEGLVMSGEGSLYVGDYQFHNGDFYIALDDSEKYELRGDDDDSNNEDLNDNINSGEIKDEYEDGKDVEIITPAGVVGNQLCKTVGALTGMQVSVSNAVIGVNTISLGGRISVSLPWWSAAADGGTNEEETTPLQDKYSKRDDLNSSVGEGKKTDDLLSLNMEEMRYGVNDSDSSAQLVGVKASGGINLTDDSLPKFTSGGAGADFTLNSIDYPGWYIGVGANVRVGDAFECEMELALVKEDSGKIYPDALKFIAAGEVVKIPLSLAGFLTRMGGGVSGLYDTIKANFNIFPPTTLSVYTGYADPTMYTFTVDEIDMSVGGQGISFTAAEGKVIGLKIFESISSHLKMYGTKMEDGSVYPCIDIGYDSRINILGIVRGEAGFWLVADPRLDTIFGNLSLGGKAYVGIFIPDYVPVVGGKELLAVMAELSTYRVYAGIRILGIPISVSYYWADRKVKFYDDWEYLEDEFSIPHGDMENALAVTYDTGEGDVSGVMLLGDNMTTLDYSARGSGSDFTYNVELKDNDYTLIQVKYDCCENILDHVTLYDPNGNHVKLVKDENCIVQTIKRENSQSGEEEHWLGIALTAPQNGTWKLKSDVQLEFEAHKVDETDCVTTGTPVVENSILNIDCDFDHLSENASADVFLVNEAEITQAQTLNETQLEKMSEQERSAYYTSLMNSEPSGFRINDEPIAVHENTTSLSVELPLTLASGSYRVRVVINDESGNAVCSDLSDDPFIWVSPYSPASTTLREMKPCGDGQFRIAWDEVNGADGYFVTLVDENKDPVDGVSGMALTGTAVDFGYVSEEVIYRTNQDGSFVLDDNGERIVEGTRKTGVLPDRNYRAVVSAYTTVDGTDCFSEPVYSEAVYLPESNPAQLILTVNGRNPAVSTCSVAGEDTVNMMDNAYSAQVNTEQVSLGLTADQNISYLMRYDGDYIRDENGEIVEYTLQEGESAAHVLDVQEGGSNIEIIALNEAGDYTETTVTVESDRTPPELLLNSVVVQSAAGIYTITGTAETDTSVTVNGTETVVQNGTFTYNGTGNTGVETVEVKALDRAGNTTTMYATVIPSELGGLCDLEIAVNGNTVSSLDQSEVLYTGQTAQLSYYGVTESGMRIPFHPDSVNVSVLMGENVIQLNGTEITGKIRGEAVIQVAYPITQDYALENTLMVQVKNETITPSEISITDTVISSDSTIGTGVVYLSVTNAPETLHVMWEISENDVLAVSGNQLVLTQMPSGPFDVDVSCNGTYIDNNGKEQQVQLSRTFTFTVLRSMEKAGVVDDVMVNIGTSFEDIPLPKTIDVTATDGSTVQVPVNWHKGAYNPWTAGSVTVYGILQENEQLRNTDEIQAEAVIVVRKLFSDVSVQNMEVTYEGSLIDVSQMFTGQIQGDNTYQLNGGTGEGTLSGNVLQVEKAGTFEVIMTTQESDLYASTEHKAVLTVYKGSQKAPQNLVGVSPSTTVQNDGAVYGTTGTMEYSSDGGRTWTAAQDVVTTGLKQGSYVFRYCEDDLYLASDQTGITLKAAAKEPQETLKLIVNNTCTYGDDPLKLKYAGGSGNGDITFVSSDSDVLEIIDDRAVVKGAGKAVITVVKAEDEMYDSAAASQMIEVKPKTAKIRWIGNTEKTYDGKPIGLQAEVVNTEDNDVCDVYLYGHDGIHAGVYKAEVSGLSNRNYTFEKTDQEYRITPVPVRLTWQTEDSMIYTGFDQLENIHAWYTDILGRQVNASIVVSEGTELIHTGSYEVSAVINDTDYQAVNTESETITITKAKPVMNLAVLKKDSIWNDFLKFLHLRSDDLIRLQVTVAGVDGRPLTGTVELYRDETKIDEAVLQDGQAMMELDGLTFGNTSVYAVFIPDETCTDHFGAQSTKILTQLDRMIENTPGFTAIAGHDFIEVNGPAESQAGRVQYRINGGSWQNSAVFTGLQPCRTYVIQARYAGNQMYEPSIPSEFTITTQYLITIQASDSQMTLGSQLPQDRQLEISYNGEDTVISGYRTYSYEAEKGEDPWIVSESIRN